MASPSASGSEDHRRRRKTLDDDDDVISQLPDSLLVQILSLLPTNEAFRTSVLCKRWKYLWTLVYNFNFDFYIKGGIVKEFESFIDNVLANSIASKIEKFKLRGTYISESNVNKWLNFAVERNVEHVVLILDDPELLIRESFYTCSSLITLDINSCGFRGDIVILWKSLKSIKLEEIELSDENIVKLVAGCPELETMELKMVDCFRRLEINSLKLKRLYLENLRVDEYETEFSMEIFAPHLQHFRISGDLEYVKFRILDMSSLINASLNFSNSCFSEKWYGEDCETDHQGFITLVLGNLQKLRCAAELTLGSWLTEVLNMLQLKGVSIPELKCKYLMLELDEAFSLYGAAGILRALPYVEKLNIDVFKWFDRHQCHFELRCLAEGDSIDLQSWISSFEFPNLKNVKIVISRVRCSNCSSNLETSNQGIDKLFKLSELLLKNAAILEKFVISTRITCNICSNFCVSPFVYQTPKRLLGCPRASMNCVILPELRFP